MPKQPRKKSTNAPAPKGRAQELTVVTDALFGDIRALIDQARNRVARAVNAGQVLLNWHIGQRIRADILGDERGEYGKQIVATLSQQLEAHYGRGYSRPNLFHMIRFTEAFPDLEIVSSLTRQLGWGHFIEIIYQKDSLKRDFYAEMCRLERWSTRALREKIGGMLYERTAIAKKPEKVIEMELAELRETDKLTPDLVFRDPYILDFLGLSDGFSEKDLENAILRELERFLLELGTDFSFVARQKRMTVDGEDFHLDLLFYHRGLRRLIAIDLKLTQFMPAHFGQMTFYLRWLDKYERRPGEEAPLGLILCSGKSAERVELLALDESDIRVAEYLTQLPSFKLLETKLREATKLARARLEASSGEE